MTDLPDWAKEKADEFLSRNAERYTYYSPESATGSLMVSSLAALLVEVKRETAVDAAKVATGMMAEQYIETRQKTLAEVRRVLEGMLPPDAAEHRAAEGDNRTLDRYWTGWTDALDTALSRLDALDPLRVEDLLDGLPRLSTEDEARGIVDGKLVKMREYK